MVVSGGGATTAPDPDGFEILIDGIPRGNVPGTGGTLGLTGLAASGHTIGLAGLAFNCGFGLSGPVAVSVSGEEPLAVELPVHCAEGVVTGRPPDRVHA